MTQCSLAMRKRQAMSLDLHSMSAELAKAATRKNIYLFLQQAFTVIHPGEQLQKAEYVEAMCFALQEVAKGNTRRLMISIAPRHLKSICASVVFPAFLLGNDPSLRFMVVSYGGDLARQHAESFRRLVASSFYRELFPNARMDPNHRRWDSIHTKAGGVRKAGSVAGPITGFGADVIVIDDLAKASEMHSEKIRDHVRNFYEETLFSRLNNKKTARIVSVQQRLHADDFSAYLIEKGTFHHLCLPSIAQKQEDIPLFGGYWWVRKPGTVLNEAREPRDVLDEIQAEIGSRTFNAQYLQDPEAGSSEFLSIEDLTLVENLPDESNFIARVQSWDTAMKHGPNSNYSVCLTFGFHATEERWYLVDVMRKRLDYTSLKAMVVHLQQRWKADHVIIEDTAMGSTLLQELHKEEKLKLGKWSVKGSKAERFIPATDWIKSGNLVIPQKVPWFDDFRREILTFPESRYNDQVDALSQFNRWRKTRSEGFFSRLNRIAKVSH